MAIARSLAKDVLVVDRMDDLARAITRGYELAGAGEPGPVVVVVARDLFRAPSGPTSPSTTPEPPPRLTVDDELVTDLVAADRVALIVGQGGQGLGGPIRTIAERLNAAVLTTSSGRGVIPETDPRSLYFDYALGGGSTVNEFLEACDLVLALGCKFTHNGTGAYALQIQADKLIHVDASGTSLGGRYPARARVESDLGAFLAGLSPRLAQRTVGWTHDDLAAWRTRIRAEQDSRLAVAPTILTDPPSTFGAFFAAFESALPADAIVVTDLRTAPGLDPRLPPGAIGARPHRPGRFPVDGLWRPRLHRCPIG